MRIDKATEAASRYFTALWSKPIKIVEVTRKEEKWLVRFEVVEEDEYMKQIARDTMIGVYQAEIDGSFEVVGYRRLGLKSRTQLEEITADGE